VHPISASIDSASEVLGNFDSLVRRAGVNYNNLICQAVRAVDGYWQKSFFIPRYHTNANLHTIAGV
jgi:hypothetical protein